jgi:ankyrin repeat protein
MTLLAKAIEEGDLTLVESLLANDSIDVNARLPRPNNPPPLVLAVRCASPSGRVDIVELLLNAGADIDGVDDNGQTACFAATEAHVLAVLITRRANLDVKDKANRTVLEFLFTYMNNRASDRIAVMLVNAGASLDGMPPMLLCWIASRSTAAIHALLNRGVVLSQLRDDHSRTPLHWIAQRTWSADADATVSMLIDVCGVDLEERDRNGQTCTHLAAAAASRHDALRCFIAAGANVNSVDLNGWTSLHCVSIYNCAVVLLAAGASVSARDREGRTAFQVAASRNPEFVSPAFLAAGADPSDVDASDRRLQRAMDAKRVETARRQIAKARLDFVRQRAIQVCIGLQSLQLDALQMCEILLHSCGPVAHLIAFHQWWTLATAVKHFHRH